MQKKVLRIFKTRFYSHSMPSKVTKHHLKLQYQHLEIGPILCTLVWLMDLQMH